MEPLPAARLEGAAALSWEVRLVAFRGRPAALTAAWPVLAEEASVPTVVTGEQPTPHGVSCGAQCPRVPVRLRENGSSERDGDARPRWPGRACRCSATPAGSRSTVMAGSLRDRGQGLGVPVHTQEEVSDLEI